MDNIIETVNYKVFKERFILLKVVGDNGINDIIGEVMISGIMGGW